MDEGFIDLRYDASNDKGGDTFWPSFTDIMMVVVMIFMIASTLLMVRNMDLVRELRATIESEREAEAMARSATQTSETLEERLAQAQHEISQIRMQLMRANEENQATRRELEESRQQVLALESAKQRLNVSLQQAQREARLSADRLRQQQAEFTQLQDTYKTSQQRLEETVTELQQLEQASQAQSVELEELRQKQARASQQFAHLEGEYADLKVKYDKLFKPARSAKGKYVVSVRYRKIDGDYRLELKDSEDGSYETVSREQMHKRLAELKDRHSDKLYVKVVIPEESGLSYSEAWNFTFNLLEQYDYYHQGD
ncbi:MAG: hypothetical protein PVF08_09515 [Gammaproteobacteria bacterium]